MPPRPPQDKSAFSSGAAFRGPEKNLKTFERIDSPWVRPFENRAQVQFSCKGEQQLSASPGLPGWVDELGRRGVGAPRRLFFFARIGGI
jgi:hypothetical protein